MLTLSYVMISILLVTERPLLAQSAPQAPFEQYPMAVSTVRREPFRLGLYEKRADYCRLPQAERALTRKVLSSASGQK